MTSSTVGPADRLHALVPCAGSGERAGTAGPKQYAVLAGRPLVAHTLAALQSVPRLASILVVLSPGDAQFEDSVPAAVRGGRVAVARCGGATRAASVASGLDELAKRGAGDADWVLVHDAARGLVQPAWIERLIDACLDDPVGGLLAVPVSDTLKRADAQGRAAATVDRQALWAAQTPQMFRLGLLRRALAHAGAEVTDEAGAVESLGLRPLLVPGDADNFKLTWPADFVRAERLMSRAREHGATAPSHPTPEVRP